MISIDYLKRLLFYQLTYSYLQENNEEENKMTISPQGW